MLRPNGAPDAWKLRPDASERLVVPREIRDQAPQKRGYLTMQHPRKNSTHEGSMLIADGTPGAWKR